MGRICSKRHAAKNVTLCVKCCRRIGSLLFLRANRGAISRQGTLDFIPDLAGCRPFFSITWLEIQLLRHSAVLTDAPSASLVSLPRERAAGPDPARDRET